MSYRDITVEMYKTAKPKTGKVMIMDYVENDGKKYFVDNSKVIYKHSKREIEVAYLLNEIFGGDVKVLPNINFPQGIKTSDYIFRNERIDLKTIISKRNKDCLKTSLRNKERQAHNFIIDNTAKKVSTESMIKQMKEIYELKGFLWVDTIYLLENKNFIKIFKRK